MLTGVEHGHRRRTPTVPADLTADRALVPRGGSGGFIDSYSLLDWLLLLRVDPCAPRVAARREGGRA